jgi:RsiW-degrading membrane proteinase PrsW (M82 family)
MLTGFLLSVLCGFVPLLFLAGIIYWLDRYEKEPGALLGGVFGWGAIVAVIGALVLQIILDQSVLILTGSQVVGEVLGASLFAPVTEEILKGLVVALIFLFAHSEFDSILDGIVYASIAALGFAATEDVLYYFSAFNEGGFGAMLALVFLRFVIFGWQHAFFTSFFGIGLAVARMSSALWIKIGAPLAGLALAIITHSLHNTLLTVITGLAGVGVAALVAWMGWLLMGAFIVYQVYREKTWLAQYLREEVDLSTITPTQYKMLTTFFGQTNARAASMFNGRYRRTARFLQLCGELTHKKRQLASMGEERGNTRMIESLRAEVNRISPTL